jgi:hypothetical protein
VLSAGAIKLESKRGLLGHAAAGALSAGVSLATGRPPDDAAGGALSAGAIKLESKRGLLGHAAAGAPSAGANEVESDGLLGHAAAGALSAGAVKLEGTGRPPGGAAAGALSASAVKLEGTGRPPGGAVADALSAGAVKLKGTRHSIGDVVEVRSRLAPTRSKARAARSAMRPPTHSRPTVPRSSAPTPTSTVRRRARRTASSSCSSVGPVYMRRAPSTVRDGHDAENPAYLFAKVFDKHRKFVHNLSGDTGSNYARRAKSIERRAAAKIK